ncbi:MAG: hypothetical protein EBU90_08175 [Proteobacteria bacterium]|nr:hypothetical protein [Pseudomonadota bacterium]NBP14912.1 hypothetical protein [bacterium]
MACSNPNDYISFNGLNPSLTYDSDIIDATTYPTIWIGAQKWMAVNLDTEKQITNITDANTWKTTTNPARCFYNNDSNALTCVKGALYNWYALSQIATTIQNTDFEIPTASDFTELTAYLSSLGITGANQGHALRSASPISTIYWDSSTATNSTGFSAIGSGWRNWDVAYDFKYIKGGGEAPNAYFWLNEANPTWVYIQNNGSVSTPSSNAVSVRRSGFSVRLLVPSVQVNVTLIGAIPGDSVDVSGNYIDTTISDTFTSNGFIKLRHGENVSFQCYASAGRVATITTLTGLTITDQGTALTSALYTNGTNGLIAPITVTVTFSEATPIPDPYLIVENNINFERGGYLEPVTQNSNTLGVALLDGFCSKFTFRVTNTGGITQPISTFGFYFDNPAIDAGYWSGTFNITHSDNTVVYNSGSFDLSYSIFNGILLDDQTKTLDTGEYFDLEFISNFIPTGGSQLDIDAYKTGFFNFGDAFGTLYPVTYPLDPTFNVPVVGQRDFIQVITNVYYQVSTGWTTAVSQQLGANAAIDFGNINMGDTISVDLPIYNLSVNSFKVGFIIPVLPNNTEFVYAYFDENNIQVAGGPIIQNTLIETPIEIDPLGDIDVYWTLRIIWSPNTAYTFQDTVTLKTIDCYGDPGVDIVTEYTIRGSSVNTGGGTITNLVCQNVTVSGAVLADGIAIPPGVSFTISYSGGDGGTYAGQTLYSTGVTGIIATLAPGTFNVGTGSLTYTLSGTPDGGNDAAFNVSFYGPNENLVTCTVLLDVTPVIDLSYFGCTAPEYPNGSPSFVTNTSLAVAINIPYTAIQGGQYAGATIPSTGVNGLQLNLLPATIDSNSSGLFIGNITGIAQTAGTAYFFICVGGYNGQNQDCCQLSINISSQTSSIGELDCNNPINTGTILFPGSYAAGNNITTTLNYSGSNGGSYSTTSIPSTGVTGLYAVLAAGTLNGSETSPGSGSLLYTIIGTPSSAGTAYFLISIGGIECTISRTIEGQAASVSNLDCAAATTNTPLISGESVDGIILSIPYTGGNGGVYAGQTIASNAPNTGVTGTLQPGTLAVGNGSLSIELSGTMPSGFVPITFTFEFPSGAESCIITLSPEIDAGTADVYCNSLTVNGTITYPTPIPANTVSLWLDYSNSNGGSYGPATFTSQAPGVGGLTATLPEGQFSLNSGFVELLVTGTPQSSGTAIFNVNIGGTVCTLNVPVSAPEGTISTLNCGGAAGTLSSPIINGSSAAGITFSVDYYGSNLGSYLSNTSASYNIVTGLTATLLAGTFQSTNGLVTYTLSGTPVGSGNATFDITVANKSCTVSLPVSDVTGSISSINCNGATFVNGPAVQGSPANITGTIPYTGGNGGSYATYTTTVSGLTLTIQGNSFVSGNGNLPFTITGTPSTSGAVSFPITIGGQSCNLSLTVVSPSPVITDLQCTGAVITGTLSPNVPATGVTISIPYVGSNNQPYPQNTSTSTGVTGLTATTPSGTLAASGLLVYTVTGTPLQTGTASFAITIGTKTCTISIPVNNQNTFGPDTPSPCQEVTYTDPGCDVLNETCTILFDGTLVTYTTVSTTDPCQVSFQVPCEATPNSTSTVTFLDCDDNVIIEEDLPISGPLPQGPTTTFGCLGDQVVYQDFPCTIASLVGTVQLVYPWDVSYTYNVPFTFVNTPPLPCSIVFQIPATATPAGPATVSYPFVIEVNLLKSGSGLQLATFDYTVSNCGLENENTNTFDPEEGALPGDEVTFTNPNCDLVTPDLDTILINGVEATITGTTPAPECSVTFIIPEGVGPGDVTIEFIDDLGNVIGTETYTIGSEGNDDGTYTVTFTPQEEGCHKIYFKTTGDDYCVYQADGPFEVGVPVTITINLIDYADCLGVVPPISCVDPVRVTGYIQPCCAPEGSTEGVVDLNFVEYETSPCQMYLVECTAPSGNCGKFTRSNCSPNGCYGYNDPTEYSFNLPVTNQIYICSAGDGIQNTPNSIYDITPIPLGSTKQILGPQILDTYPFNSSNWTTTGSVNWDPFLLCSPQITSGVYSPEPPGGSGGSVFKSSILTPGSTYQFTFTSKANFVNTLKINAGGANYNVNIPANVAYNSPILYIQAVSNTFSVYIPAVLKGTCFQLTSLRELSEVELNCCSCFAAEVTLTQTVDFYYTECTENGSTLSTVTLNSGVNTINCAMFGSIFPVNKYDSDYITSIEYMTNSECIL